MPAWTEELELKFFGLLRPTRAFLPLLRKSDAASMVYVSSLLAKQPETYIVATGAARAGTLNLAKTMSVELPRPQFASTRSCWASSTPDSGTNASPNGVASGDTIEREAYIAELARERGIPLGRIGRPEEVSAAIAFLASPVRGYMTGTVIELAGGISRYV